MKLVAIGIIALLQFATSQPPTFIPYEFDSDGFQISRGYFSPLNTRHSCQDLNYQNCIYSNFINPSNILFVPSQTTPDSYTSTFKLSASEAIVIAGFAPPISKYFTITPYASFINGIGSFSSISNNSLTLDSTFFIVVISGDIYTFNLIREWFKNANTSLTTAIYNNPDKYLYHLPIVQSNDDLNINANTEYSVIVRIETTTSSQQDLYETYLQSPSLMAWKVSATDDIYNQSQSQIFTELQQLRISGNDETELSLPSINVNSDKNSKITTINQNQFNVINYDSSECLSQEFECDFDRPDSVIFESIPFKLGYNKKKQTKIFVAGINHIKTENARFATINLVNFDDKSIISQITLDEVITDEDDGYIVIFAENCPSDSNIYCQEIEKKYALYKGDIQIVEISSNETGIEYTDLQAPYAKIVRTKTQKSSKSKSKQSGSKRENEEVDESSDDRPNIVMIMMDDLGWKDVGYNGAEYETPNIDDLAESGVILNQYYTHPACTPTRTAMYTGRYCFRYNLSTPMDIGQRRFLPENIEILPEVLSNNGYDTHLVGKWHTGYPKWSNFPFGRGFDTFYGLSGGWFDFYNHQRCWPIWDDIPYPNIAGVNNLKLLNEFFPEGLCAYDFFDQRKIDINTEYSTTLFGNRAIDILSGYNKNSNPFFMFLSFAAPHTPILETPEVYDECDIARDLYGNGRYNYCNMILEADKYIGRVVDILKQNKLWDNTVIIFSTDNGARPRYVRGHVIWDGYGSNLPLRSMKSSPFEGGVRGIGFINGGYLGLDNRGIINNKLYHVVDWYKTIIFGIAGIDYDDPSLLINDTSTIDSLNIWDSILNDTNESPRTEWAYSSNFGGSITTIRSNDWKLVLNPRIPPDGYWDVDNVTLAPGQNESESVYLFNISNDEIESINLKDIYPDIVDELQQRLLEIQDEGWTPNSGTPELEGMIIAILSGSQLPFLDITQEIKIDLD